MSVETDGMTREEGGVVRLLPAVTQWAWSPDDAHLAVALADPDAAGRSTLCVLEAAGGRVVTRVAGRSVLGLGWASPEHLVVTRAQDLGTRAVLHAVPDGAVLGSVALPGLHGGRQRVVASASGGGVVLVAPWRLHGGSAARGRQRAAYVLGAEGFEVLREVLPGAWRVVPASPHPREMVATLEPDGARVLCWLGENDGAGAPGGGAGHLVRYDWRDDRAERVCRAGARVAEVLSCDPTRVALRESHGEDAAARGDLALVDLDEGAVLSSTAGGDDAIGPWGALDLHPDRERLLVACRAPDARGEGTVRAFDLATGLADGPPVRAKGLAGAAWRGDGDGLWVLRATARGATIGARERLRDAAARDASPWVFALDGRRPSQHRLAWTPARTRLVASWRCVPDRADAALRALGVSRLAWVRPG